MERICFFSGMDAIKKLHMKMFSEWSGGEENVKVWKKNEIKNI